MRHDAPLYIGLMSGTSLDGVDAVLADVGVGSTRLLASLFRPYENQVRSRVLSLQDPSIGDLESSALLSLELTELYASCVLELLERSDVQARDIAAIGCHGQTVRHQPSRGYSLQLANGALLAEKTGITVVCDFRSRDVAAGGQGAPLVPAFHAAMFSHARFSRAIVNIGGIANISHLPPNACVRGFDCGPGNILMDGWARKWLGRPMDESGQWARTGAVVEDLLKRWLAHPFFNMKPPKSTGRELFNDGWISAYLAGTETPQDVQRTLLELTAQSVAIALNAECADAMEIYACGGGAHNALLMERIAQLLPGKSLAPSSTVGIDPDWVEALAFAWLARQTTTGLPGNLPLVTGARGPRILGAIHQA